MLDYDMLKYYSYNHTIRIRHLTANYMQLHMTMMILENYYFPYLLLYTTPLQNHLKLKTEFIKARDFRALVFLWVIIMQGHGKARGYN